MNGTSAINRPETETNGDVHVESENQITHLPNDNFRDKKTMYENRTDDEKCGSLQMDAPINTSSKPSANIEEDKLLLGSTNASRGAVDEMVQVTTVSTAQSSAVSSKVDGWLLNLEEDDGSFRNQTRYSYAHFNRNPSLFFVSLFFSSIIDYRHYCVVL